MVIEFAIVTLTVVSVSLITISYKKHKKMSKQNNFPIIGSYCRYPEIRI